MEKIAVHCPTEDLAIKVLAKMGHENPNKKAYDIRNNLSCGNPRRLGIVNKHDYSDVEYWDKSGHRIIEAEEYLGGGESVKQEFKVGDEVEVIRGNDVFKKGQRGEITNAKLDHSDELVNTDMSNTYFAYKKDLKLVNSKHLKEEVTMADLISRVMADEKHKDVQLVEKHKAKIIGNMEDTIYNERMLVTFGSGQLLAIATELENAEKAEQDKS